MAEPRVFYNAIKEITVRMTPEEIADPRKARIVFSPEEGFLRIPTGEIETPSEGFLRAPAGEKVSPESEEEKSP